MFVVGNTPLNKRLPVKVDRTKKIQHFGVDNIYPQRAKEIMHYSYTLSGIIEKKSGFLNGEGFSDKAFGDSIVFQKGTRKQTANQLLDKVAADYSWARGIALHVNYDLNYEICQVSHVPFEYIRLGLPDDDGCVTDLWYCTNWEADPNKEDKWKRKIYRYNRFNPDPAAVEAQVIADGGIENYKGQIFYWTPDDDQYPLCSFDAVFEHAQTQAETSLFQLANVVNGFNASHIFFYPSKFETDEERKEFKKSLAEHKGAMGANSTMVIEAGTADVVGKDLVVKTDLPDVDKLWEFTSNQTEKAMLQRYGMPYPILGKMPDTGLFNQQQIVDSYTYYNSVTRDDRNVISAIFSQVFQFWAGATFTDFSIVPQQYIIEQSNSAAAPASTATPPTQDPTKPGSANPAQAAPVKPPVNEAFKSIGEAGLNRILKIVNRYNLGKNDPQNSRALTYDQAVQFLKGYGLTETEIPSWLITSDEEDDV